MSKPIAIKQLPLPNTSDRQRGLLRLGLIEFCSQALSKDGSLLPLLRGEAAQFLGPEAPLSWPYWRDRVTTDWTQQDGALGRLIADLALTPAETFLLTLAGEVETTHLINLVLGELQAPNRSSRPFVHLGVALTDALYPSTFRTAQDVSRSPLVRSGILSIDGDGPVPLRVLGVHPSFWSILNGDPWGWPECRLRPPADAHLLPRELREEIPKLVELLTDGEMKGILIRGNPGSGRTALAGELAHALGLTAIEIPVSSWERHPVLGQACRYADWLPVLQPSLGPGEIWRPEFGRAPIPVAVLLGNDGAVETDDFLELVTDVPNEAQRIQLWKQSLDDSALAAEVAASALLSGRVIERVATNARLLAKRENRPLNRHHLAEARRSLGAERLRLLSQPVESRVEREALVVPPSTGARLDDLILRARRRESLWAGLGTTLRSTPNPGVRALFVGESGTGKTLAASYVATTMGAPLYRVDLSAVMNKYIGESEKNLSALLDLAAANDVVLLFDEADSLFGHRTGGKETGERYANMLTNFLLSRIEHHPGIVLLTSNSRERIDTAFTRRIDFIIELPLPGYQERLALWRSHLGDRGPGEEVYRELASYCDFAGGQLRNVVIAAAARAQNRSISGQDLLHGLRGEYGKIGRALPEKLASIGRR